MESFLSKMIHDQDPAATGIRDTPPEYNRTVSNIQDHGMYFNDFECIPFLLALNFGFIFQPGIRIRGIRQENIRPTADTEKERS
jgi:hypothetical protein